MKYFAQSAFEHIKEQMELRTSDDTATKRVLCMMPSIPSTAAVKLGEALEGYCLQAPAIEVPIIKIAFDLCEDWRLSSDSAVRADFDIVVSRQWNDSQGNLTSYRNSLGPGAHLQTLLLIGVDRVTDSGSLADFHHCDFTTIWRDVMKRSFDTWTIQLLTDSHIGFDVNTLRHFDTILQSLKDKGLADIVQISALLESIDLVPAQDGRDCERILLSSLHSMNLPSFSSFDFGKRGNFRTCLDDAVGFLSYDSLLEERARKKLLTRLTAVLSEHPQELVLIEDAQRVGFSTDRALIEALEDYIESGDSDLRESLRHCDFAAISDRIFNFKPIGPIRTNIPPLRRLSGGPIEVILTAIWRTLGEFCRESKRSSCDPNSTITAVSVRSLNFRHDCAGDNSDARKRNALACLQRLLGGLDSWLREWLQLINLEDGAPSLGVDFHLLHDALDLTPCRGAEPSLEFKVDVIGLEVATTRRYAWRLPDIHEYRIVDELYGWAASVLGDNSLPVYNIPYFDEVLLAKDSEETRRVLLQCIRDGAYVFNLLSAKDLDRTDPLLPHVHDLARTYKRFVTQASTHGIHEALRSNGASSWDGLRRAYEQACDAYLSHDQCMDSSLGPPLFKSFLALKTHDPREGDQWVWQGFEPAAVVTALHPALLEMLQAHIVFLLGAFATLVPRELKAASTTSRPFKETTWRSYVDLAAIQMPLCGLICDRNRILHTDVRGEHLIHRIGNVTSADSSLTTKLLLRYDSPEDDDVSDAELFAESRESQLIQRILLDYVELHPHAEDGLSLGIYRNQDIQPVISAVDGFLSEISRSWERHGERYTLAVTLFTESSDDSGIARWIRQWKERWEASETEPSLTHYRTCRLSVAHRIVSPDEDYAQFRRLITNGLQLDLAILYGFIAAGADGNEFEVVEPYDVRDRSLKFPVLEKPFCSMNDPGRRLHRARVLSNRQFGLGTRHAEIMARLKSGSRLPASHLVLGFGDYRPWVGVVDALHKRAEWVVCIDPSVDERLIAHCGTGSGAPREIIGFGSGVGTHGEANYTISTSQFSLSDVQHRLSVSVGDLFTGWGGDALARVASGVLTEAKRLAGLSLVRATGIGEYIRDFMAYAIVRKVLTRDQTTLCDPLVSLDAYRHWFDASDYDTRPDLLWMQASISQDGSLHLDMRLVECKLAMASEAHLTKARIQLENGLRHLTNIFKPRNDAEHTEDERPDQRYWWLQLHRLVASKTEVSGPTKRRVLAALERLAVGDFSIEWRAAVVALWTNETSACLTMVDTWHCPIAGGFVGIAVVTAGSEFVRGICSEPISQQMPWSDRFARFEADRRHSYGRQGELLNSGDIRPPTSQDLLEATPTPAAEPAPQAQTKTNTIPTDTATTVTPQEPQHITMLQPPAGSQSPSAALPLPPQTILEASSDLRATLAQDTKTTAPPPRKVPQRILLGRTLPGDRDVFWEFGNVDLSNRHMLIFGTSGMGKTYAIQCILCELGLSGLPSLIIDYTNGFLPEQLETETRELLDPLQHIVRRAPLPINPFRTQSITLDGSPLPETPSMGAKRISGVFQKVYDLGEQQFSALFDALTEGLQTFGEQMTLDRLMEILTEFSTDDSKNKNPIITTLSKIKPFVMDSPFSRGEATWDWQQIFEGRDSRCHVFQLAGMDLHTQQLTTEFAMWDFYSYLQSKGQKDVPKVLVLDEVQNLDQTDGSPLSKYLREGRKFGVSLIMATQIMSSLTKDERDRMFNAGHKLFFRPADTEMRAYADIAAVATGEAASDWVKRLSGLKKGECYSLGPSLNTATGKLELKAFKIRISPLSERCAHD